MINLWECRAKERGLELDEVFIWQSLKYKITLSGLKYFEPLSGTWEHSNKLIEFLKGYGEIYRLNT